MTAVLQTRRADRTASGIGLSMLAMFCFASMDAFSKVLARDYAIAQMLWVRYAFFVGFALLMTRRGGIRASARSARPWLQTGRALLLVFENGAFVLAFRYLPLADVHAIAAVSPLIVILLSGPTLGEKVGIARWIAVTAGFAGVLVIIRPGFHSIGWPVLVPLAGALLWGVYQILVRLCGRFDGPETTLFWSAVVGFAATSVVGPFQWKAPDLLGWERLVPLALLGSLGQYTLIKALQFAEASAVQPFSYTLLLWAATLGALVFGNVPDGWTIAGAAVIVASGLYSWHWERLRSHATSQLPGHGR